MDMQNVSNLTIPEGQVRTIHDKNNRLLWGRVNYDTKYKGDTTQQIYSGKNMLDKDATPTKLLNGATISVLSNGIRVINSGASLWGCVLLMHLDASEYIGKTLTVSANVSPSSTNIPRMTFSIHNADASSRSVVSYADGTGFVSCSYTVTSVDASKPFLGITLYANNNGTTTAGLYVDYTNLQVEIGSSPTSYEPYDGEIPSPTPTSPQPIHVVTGEQTVQVTGKNLFDNTIAPTMSVGTSTSTISNGIRVMNTSSSGMYHYALYKVFEAKKYLGKTITFSCKMAPSSTNDTKAYVGLCNASGTSRAQKVLITSTGSMSYTVEEDNERPYVCIVLYSNNNVSSPPGVYVDYTDIQLEVGASATPFQPYQGQSYTIDLGSTELCKIGTYQDYIYPSNGDWYVHKATNKITFYGGDDETWWAEAVGGVPRYYHTNVADAMTLPSTNVMSPMNSNYYTPTTPSNLYNAVVDYGISLNSGTAKFRVRNKDVTSIANFKTWLSNNNTTVYYPLATSTDTQITDTTLISQLDAIHEWMTRYGYNSVVTGNLPIIIDRTNL